MSQAIEPLREQTGFFRIMPVAGPDAGTAAYLLGADRIIEIDADFTRNGVWSGVAELVEQAYLAFRDASQTAVLDEHNYALYMTLFARRSEIGLKYACLTDTASGSEKTRNFPLDRAYRLVNGLVSLIKQWKAMAAPDQRWTLVVRNFARAQHLAIRFFVELARRLGCGEQLAVVVKTDNPDLPEPGMARLMRLFPVAGVFAVPATRQSLLHASGEFDPALYASLIEKNDMLVWEGFFSPVLAHFRAVGDHLSAARVALRALCLYNHYGYYHESGSFVDTVMPHLAQLVDGDEDARWNYIGNMFQGLVTTGAQEQGLRLIQEYAMPYLTRPELLAKMNYLLAMVYLRYLKQQDLVMAEKYILAAVDCIAAAKGRIPDAEQAFLSVFIDNGLAFLRVRQNRREEALQLCNAGFVLLSEMLGDAAHRLHRSVLLYNSAQVYVQLGNLDQALKYYYESIKMDPYYSEYYNECANLLQRQGQYEQALPLYDMAIKYSAPYPEVYSNKGMCHAHLDQTTQALTCFAFSLELDPGQQDVYTTRAEILDAMEETDLALEDYAAAIAFPADSATARVNRAVIHFSRGDLASALVDMNRAIELEPDNSGHYENRAEIFRAMEKHDLVEQDLSMAERFGKVA